MVAVALTRFGGMAPLIESRLLPEQMAEEAVNVNASRGSLNAYHAPVEIYKFPVAYKKAYRLTSKDRTAHVWLGLTSEFACVVRSPLANDTERRVYWTIPGAVQPYWSTYQRIADGLPPYNLGMPQPPTGVALTVDPVGGTATPLVERSYLFTWLNAYGEESAPCLPSLVVSGPPDASWDVTGLPTVPPLNPVGVDYPPVVRVRLYRTVSGDTTAGEFFQVAEFDFDGVDNPVPPAVYHDLSLDTDLTGNTVLATSLWGNPPAFLDGLTALPGGMLVGFVGNTVHFCAVDRPHTWPASYDQSLHCDIVAMTYWQRSLVVLTHGYPSVGTGLAPLSFVFQQIQSAEPCIARGSVVTDLSGVFYSSQNGLVRLSPNGATNQTVLLIGEDMWVPDYRGDAIVACRHRSQYLAVVPGGYGVGAVGTYGGWVIDFAERRRGLVKLSSLYGASAVWSDEESGDTYVMGGTTVYRWDDTAGDKLVYRWRSKRLFQASPNCFGACQVELHEDVESSIPPISPPMDPGEPSLGLPDGVNASITIFAFPHVFTRALTKRMEIFRLPSGFLSFDWQAEIISRVPVYSVELASTMRELRKTPVTATAAGTTYVPATGTSQAPVGTTTTTAERGSAGAGS